MAERTSIEWTRNPATGEPGSTWNPLRGTRGRWHCVRVSPGCDHCYAARMNHRFHGPDYVKGADAMRLDEASLVAPMRWRKPRLVFVCSMTDIAEQSVPDAWIARIFRVMAQCPRHTFIVLTKRPARLARLVQPGGALAGFSAATHPNVWVGATIEHDDFCWRADHLRRVPARVLWISAEPMLGPLSSLDLSGINWVVVGGESGPGYRPLDPVWAAALRDRCLTHGIRFFFKQHGGRTPTARGRLLQGRTWDEYPLATGGIT